MLRKIKSVSKEDKNKFLFKFFFRSASNEDAYQFFI